ncbi:MAG TPA: hypothetical protein VGF67_01700 [Ktedonobacteraceae bacterium]|jgi:hypothetical protein
MRRSVLEGQADPALIAITSGSPRDQREDLTAWMLAQATPHEGKVPLFCNSFLARAVTR